MIKWSSIMSHRPLNGEEYPLNNSLPHGLSSDQDEDYPATLRNRGLHYASIAEKKRLWWRNAIINALFIASWCVTYLVSFDAI